MIVDEAHNLIDVLLSLNSQSISLSSLPQLISALKVYQKRYQKLLKGSNAMYLKQFLAVLTGLEGFGARWKGKGKGGEGMLGVNELMEGMGGTLDTINLLTLVQWLAESKIGRKVRLLHLPYEEPDSTDRRLLGIDRRERGDSGGQVCARSVRPSEW